MKTKICIKCKKEFIPKDNYQKICSNKCKFNWPDSGYYVCKNCGKIFFYKEGQLNWTKKGIGNGKNSIRSDLFCCYDCGVKHKKTKAISTRLKQNNGSYRSKEEQEKIAKTNIKNNGGLGFASKKICEKNYSNRIKRGLNKYYNNREKYKQTCLEKYGVENPSQIEEIKKKKEKTAVKHFGAIGWASPIIKEKALKNCKYSSKLKTENKLFILLCKKYPNTKRQYKSSLYPFFCDFYIPDLNLYIEYQGFVTHGKEPYNENNEEHKKILKNLYKKINKSSFYQSIINVWTISDPLKRKTAKENNLNYLEFFNEKQFMEWYNNQ